VGWGRGCETVGLGLVAARGGGSMGYRDWDWAGAGTGWFEGEVGCAGCCWAARGGVEARRG
jgi:hypothetical protein